MIKLVTSQAYSAQVVRAINASTSRVYVLALIVQQSDDAAAIITALNRAAHRGVDVQVMADFSTYSYARGHLIPASIYSRSTQIATDMVNRLTASGVKYTWLGMQHPFLFAGRTHSKWIICDNTVFAFGGINLYPNFRKDRDYMFMFHDAQLADALAYEHHAIREADAMDTAYPSTSFETDRGTLLVDGGVPLDSLIYRRATAIAGQAQHVLMVTQYCPTGRLAKRIRQTPHRVYYNRPFSDDMFTNGLINVGKKLSGIANAYAGSEYIHAKFMIATNHDGTKTAITGSHNFISYGGLLGTREIALETSDPVIIGALEQYFTKYIA